jgi:DNA-binding PucR family transcriptional regulator
MANITSEQDQSVEIVIPATYLEDARKALSIEIALDAESIAQDDPLERHSTVEILQRDVRLQQQILTAEGDVKVSAERDRVSSPIEHMLDEIVRVVAKRLDDAKEYGPTPMGTILDIADELRWAANEAIRIAPSEFDWRREA